MVETTALGAAGLAGLQVGVWGGPEEFAQAVGSGRTFESALAGEEREALVAGWEAAVGGTLAMVGES